jgi:hypothetical protein
MTYIKVSPKAIELIRGTAKFLVDVREDKKGKNKLSIQTLRKKKHDESDPDAELREILTQTRKNVCLVLILNFLTFE